MKIFGIKNEVSALVLQDIASKFWFQYFLIGLFSAFAFTFQIVGISIIIHSFNENLSLPFNMHDRFSTFIINPYVLIFASFIILSLSAILIFMARKITVDLMIEYESVCANELARIVFEKNDEELKDSEIIRLLSKDCRFGGRIVQEISNIVMPLGISIIAFPMLFYLNFTMTIIIIFVIIGTLLPYGFLASKASFISYAFEKSAILDSQYKKEMVNKFRKTKKFDEPPEFPHSDFKRDYKARLIIPHYGLLIGGIQISFCLAILAWWFATGDKSSLNLANVVLYGFVAMFTLNQLRGATKIFASFHVFLAYFKRAFFIIKDIDHGSQKNSIADDDNHIPIVDEDV